MNKPIRVGTRDSKLAIIQTNWVISNINSKYPHLKFEVVKIKTTGDRILDQRLDKIGGKGLFIKEIEAALEVGNIDFAVHSMKDMPANISDKFDISTVSSREDARDVLITADNIALCDLKDGAVIGTSSVRREVQILELGRSLNFKMLRGNVLTRLKKLYDKEYDGIVLAMAGLKRLGLEDTCSEIFGIQDVIPAVGQGALAIETRAGEEFGFLKECIHHEDTAVAVSCERAFMIELSGSCTSPIAAHAVLTGSIIKLYGMRADDDKSHVYRDSIEGERCDAILLGKTLAKRLKNRRLSDNG